MGPGSTSTTSETRRGRAGPVLDAYLAEVEAGRPVDPEEWVGRHPAIADRLRACLKASTWSRRRPRRWPSRPEPVRVDAGRGDADADRPPIDPTPTRPTARRLPRHPRARPRRHGRRLRGRAALAGPSRGPEGPAVRRRHRPATDRPVPRRGPGGLAPEPPAYRPGLLGRLPARRPLLRHAAHRRADPRRVGSTSSAARGRDRRPLPTPREPGSASTASISTRTRSPASAVAGAGEAPPAIGPPSSTSARHRRPRRPSSGRPPGWAARPPRPSSTPTSRACSTATSSRRT